MTTAAGRRYGLPWRGADVAKAAEAAGVAAFCSGEFVDHEAYSTLAEMALCTERAQVGFWFRRLRFTFSTRRAPPASSRAPTILVGPVKHVTQIGDRNHGHHCSVVAHNPHCHCLSVCKSNGHRFSEMSPGCGIGGCREKR